MTQSYNLSQLANNLNSSGQLDATDGLVGAVPVLNGGTGSTTAAGARTNLDVAQAVFAVPSGGIIMWSGAIAAIPTGWFLCNGANSTPDLRNQFIVGASVDNAGVSNTTITGSNTKSGGSKDAALVSHTHIFTGNALGTHSHTVIADSEVLGGSLYPGGSFGQTTTLTTNAVSAGTPSGTNSTVGTTATNANLVPYYALAFIMKS